MNCRCLIFILEAKGKLKKTAYFMTSGKLGFWPTYPHNQLSTSVSQLGINIAVISRILQQDVSCVFPWKLGQIGLPMSVLDSSHQEDFQTPKT